MAEIYTEKIINKEEKIKAIIILKKYYDTKNEFNIPWGDVKLYLYLNKILLEELKQDFINLKSHEDSDNHTMLSVLGNIEQRIYKLTGE